MQGMVAAENTWLNCAPLMPGEEGPVQQIVMLLVRHSSSHYSIHCLPDCARACLPQSMIIF
jgi:hypothetical protein